MTVKEAINYLEHINRWWQSWRGRSIVYYNTSGRNATRNIDWTSGL